MTTTRVEIAEHVVAVFGQGPVHREQLLAAAARTEAPERVMEQLRRLPERRYRDLRDLWPELPGIPVEA